MPQKGVYVRGYRHYDTCTFLLKVHSIAVQLTDSQPLTLLKFHNQNNQLLLLFSSSVSLSYELTEQY